MRIGSVFAGLMIVLQVSCICNNSFAADAPPDRFVAIHNDFYWADNTGARILTRSGCLCQFNGIYYWYGGNPRGFREQNCYSSTDFIHWTNRGVVLRQDVDANRIAVIYNDTTKQYVMILKYNGNGAHLAFATADKPEGPFTFKDQTLVDNALMGDMTVYKDTDGKAYLCYVSWAVGTNAQHGIYRLSSDYLSLDKRMFLWDIRGREAPHIFKRNDIYYYGTSRTAGIQSSGTSYYTAKDLAGPWTAPDPLKTPGSENSWDSQVNFIFPIQGSKETLYLYAGDRWVKNATTGRNGDYVWLPMEFNGDTPVVNYYQDWEVNLATGQWRKFDPARNLAAGKPVTASSVDGTNVASHVTDATTWENYANTRWQSAAGDSQWIMVDLQAPTDVNRVVLKWNNNAAKDFKIQTSTDATTWTDVFSTNLGSSDSVTDEIFPTTKARYVRMLASSRAPMPAQGFGGGGGFGRRGATQRSATQFSATRPFNFPPAATRPTYAAGYSLFEFMILKD